MAEAPDIASDAVAAQSGYVSLHTADPGANGTNEVTGGGYSRQSATWGTSSGGVVTVTNTPLQFSGPASGTVTHFGLWDQATGGTFIGGDALSGDQSFNAAGAYNVTASSITTTVV